MRSYVNRVAQISSKLTKEQILTLLNNLVDENEDLHSILESINCGLLILDENFCLKQNNTVVLNLELYAGTKERAAEICRYLKKDTTGFYKNFMKLMAKKQKN